MKKNLLLAFFLVTIANLPWGCNSPDGGGDEGARRETVAGPGRGSGSQGANGSQGDQARSSHAEGGLPGAGQADNLESMPLGELMLLKQERLRQDKSEQAELELLDAVNKKLCQKLEEKRSNCPAIKRLIYDASERSLSCGTKDESEAAKSKIEITIPAEKAGSFILIANDLYKSSAFGPGTSEITFSSTGDDMIAPQFIKIYKLVLRTATESPQQLPDIQGFRVKLTVDGNDLLDDLVSPSQDTGLSQENKEYSVSVDDIATLRKSSVCRVDQNQIEELKLSIRNTVTQDQALEIKDQFMNDSIKMDEVGDPELKKKEVISEITALRSMIAARFPVLEGERNRQFRLTNELKTDIHLGCQYRRPIESFAIELEGSINDRVFLGKQKQKKPDRIFDGKAKEVLFDFGAVKFTIDFSKRDIFGIRYPYDKDISDEAITGGLDRVAIRKKGLTYDNVTTACDTSGGIFGSISKVFWDKTCYEVYEVGVITISGLTIYVNDKKAYSKKDMQIKLSKDDYKYSADLQSNEQWVKFMQDEECNVTN